MTNLVHRARVERVEWLTPGMVRIVLGGDGLEGFVSTGVGDEYLRVFLPRSGDGVLVLPEPTDDGYWSFADGAEPGEVRCYTVRAWDEAARLLTLDFVVHDGGFAASWARTATVGDEVGVNTPKGLFAPPEGMTWQLLVADATGLPAAARIVESTPAHVRSRIVIEVQDADHEQPIAVPSGSTLTWVHGGNGHGATRLEEIVASATLPAGVGYVWVAGETRATRGVRKRLRHELGLPPSAYKVVGYWTERAEAWMERFEALPQHVLDEISAMWSDEGRDEEEVRDEYDAVLETHGL